MWVLESFGMFAGSIILYLSVRYSQKLNVDKRIVNTANFAFPAIAVGIYMLLFNPNLFHISWFMFFISLLVSLFISYLGNIASLTSIENAPNPGYSLIIQKSYTLLTTVVSILFFQGEFNTTKLIGILIVLIASSIVLLNSSKSEGIKNQKPWIMYSIYCFFAFGALSLVSRWMVKDMGMDSLTRIFYGNALTALWVIPDLIKNNKSNPLPIEISKKQLLSIIGVGLGSIIFAIFLQLSRVSSPNVGYSDAINASSNAILTVLAAIIFKDELTKSKFIGVLGVTIGIILIII